ncbi:MAG: glycerophosphodiester phosphodiesterase [Planctomycetota bacterium]
MQASFLPPLPRIIGHRGVRGRAPENTLAGFRKAAGMGLSWVEFDVALTADEVPVLLHDETLDRTTAGEGPLAEATWAGIRGLDAGSWFGPEFAGERIPSLEEAVDLLRELGLGANVEIKPTPGREAATGERVACVLRSLAPDSPVSTILSSFSQPALRAARTNAPRIPRGLLVREVAPGWRATLEELGCGLLHSGHEALTREAVDSVREAGYPLLAFTVNERPRARQLFSWGVQSVFSDDPEALLPLDD